MPRKRKQQIGANEPCPCGSGKLYIECCLDKGYEFVRSSSNGKVSKRVKFKKKGKKKKLDEEFSGDVICRKGKDVKAEEDIPASLRKEGAIYRIGPSFDDIAKEIKAMIPIIGVDFVDGSYNFIRALFMPKMSMRDLRRVYEILEMEKLRVMSYLDNAVLEDNPSSDLSGVEDILLLIVTKDHKRHFNIREDYEEFGLYALRDMIGFLEGTKLEVLLEIIRRSLSEGMIRSIMSDV